jgi:hypothetical protein
VELFPALPLDSWRETKETLHRFLQIVGKIRLAASSRRNHWWNVPFHLTGSGITTRPMGPTDTGEVFTIDFDFTEHRLEVRTLSGRRESFPLTDRSVADFYRDLTGTLISLGIDTEPEHPYPFDLPDHRRAFAFDTEHRSYDPQAVGRYWHILTQVTQLLELYATGYSGKTSPVHHFWHTFDIAVTRFSERRIDHPGAVDPVTREAYSREAISAGFWFGDDSSYPNPAFYSYTAPEPPGLADRLLVPSAARWVDGRGGSHLALLPYEEVRTGPEPRVQILRFLNSAYRAGADLADWRPEQECPGGITDPLLAGRPQPGTCKR